MKRMIAAVAWACASAYVLRCSALVVPGYVAVQAALAFLGIALMCMAVRAAMLAE